MPGKKDQSDNRGIYITNDQDAEFGDNMEMANFANNYFVQFGPSLANLIKSDNHIYLDTLPDLIQCKAPLSCLPAIQEQELARLCRKINVNKASNIEDIQNKFFKDCMLCTIPQICYLYNLIFVTTHIPDSWKSAIVVPIFKAGNTNKISNYRPISSFPQIVKTLEKLIFTRLYDYIEQKDLLSDAQGGFRPRLGINDTIGKFLGDIYDNINKGVATLCIFFDLKKAFDTIDHRILLKKLKLMGFVDDLLDLLKNYLHNRYQITQLNDSQSIPMSVSCGVPQGSTLGPLLFILYINDLPSYIPDIHLKLYADDTVFYTSAPTILEANMVMNTAANKFSEWCGFNKLTINLQKSKCILFSNKKLPSHKAQKDLVSIKIGGIQLDLVDHYKYLGVILDDRLTFHRHVNYLISLISHRLYIL